MECFRFKQFEVRQDRAALKVGTDAVLLGAAMTVSEGDRTALDIGTGSGVIALMAAQRSPFCGITGIDIDAPSILDAEENFAASPWAERLEAKCVSLEDFAAAMPDTRFDHIFSNPPFYDNSLRNPDARESAARHTESLGFKDICRYSAEHLNPEGRLSLILPSESETSLRRTASSFGLGMSRIIRIRTTAAKPFRRIIVEFSRGRRELREDELVLQDGPSRTREYLELTEEFYL